MIGVGPFPMSLVALLLALVVAVAVGKRLSRGTGEPPLRVVPVLIDMLVAGVIAARLGFIIAWWPQYAADPWAAIRMGDGGYLPWAGVLAGLAFGAWKARRRRELRRPLAWSAGAGLASWALLSGVLWLMQQSAPGLPTAELTTLDRTTTTLSTLAGKPMVVNLWATWCPPCRREMPVLAAAQAKRSDVTFAFVNQGESEQVIRAYLAGQHLALGNVLLDPFSSVSQEAGSRGLPTTLLFDADGRLVDTHMGELSEASLMQKLQRFGPAPGDAPKP